MLGMTSTQLIYRIVQAVAAFAVATWNAVAGEPKLQVMLAGWLLLMMIGGATRAPRRVRHW